MPQAALIVRHDLDIAPHAALGHYTHEKSPLGSAAALATIGVIERDGLVAHARVLGVAGHAQLEALRARHPAFVATRHIGAFFGVELRGVDGGSSAALADRVLYAALARGLSFKVGGGNVLTLCPPLTIDHETLEHAISILDDAITAASCSPPSATWI